MSKAVSLLRTNPRLGKRQRLTVDATVGGVQFTAANYTILGNEVMRDRVADAAVIQIFDDEIYWTLDGSTPSSTVGFRSGPGDFINLVTQQQVQSFKTIRVTANAALEGLFLFN